ncbi:RNA polymerase II-associated protein 1 [Drosophila willistoni]|uniref:RNA polymerase II-associated protein 1 n=1 Tax=Drosophila willistoni TaxID=7260 RepID=UPI001F07FAA5|nr:RNA polymerase II-associated protein 1 [Drosophila willistoni]
MFKKLKPGETEEDVLRMAAEFNAEREKNPSFQPAATVVRVPAPAAKKSVFAQKREQAKLNRAPEQKQEIENKVQVITSQEDEVRNQKILLDEIHENILGDVRGNKVSPNLIDNVLGEITERNSGCKRKLDKTETNKPRSIFARQMMGEQRTGNFLNSSHKMQIDKDDLGAKSSIIKDEQLAKELHAENLNVLNQMSSEDILAERQKLLETLDPALIAMLGKKREPQTNAKATPMVIPPLPMSPKLPESNPALEILQQSDEGQWLNFNLIEEHKLAWMRDIPAKVAQLKPGQQFDARFDWKGVLLPHTLPQDEDQDSRELYLHGEEAERPGYTLQELFRLARSTVLQQRLSAFGAIAGIFSIYNQGFYDQVLTLPISKMFFLLRFGLDDNTPAQLEVVSRALARLCYNETDEVVLDYIYNNAYCHWQPSLQVAMGNAMDESDPGSDPTSLAFLQNYMKLLRSNPTSVRAEIDEDEGESRTSMDDFQLAETDLIDCLLRTNILQRITFILTSVRPENSTVDSCLKLLIRIARTSSKVARQLANESRLFEVLLTNFMPPLRASVPNSGIYYGHPQFLCLKLLRVLIGTHLDIAKAISKDIVIERLQQYLFHRDDIKSPMIRVQIEALRILRCLILLGIVHRDLYRQFLPALRQMLDWHYNHCVFEVGGSSLIRQHAAALLVAIVASGESGICDIEMQKMLLEPLNNCCCKWFHTATRSDMPKDFSQLTLLSTSLYAVKWFASHSYVGRAGFPLFLRSILPNYANSSGFIACAQQLTKGSIILRQFGDRRHVHAPLPNMGAVLMHDCGPQLIVSDTYPVQLLSNVWALLEDPMETRVRPLFEAVMQPAILEPLAEYLTALSTKLNRILASNIFARSELRFIHQLLCTDGLETYLERTQLLRLVYSYLCSLSTADAKQIKSIFNRYIFNEKYMELNEKSLALLEQTCLEMVYPHVIADNREPSLTLSYIQAPILPPDWPYFQLRLILSNYLENVQQRPAVIFSEHHVVRMTLTFVQQLEQQGLQIVSPLEKLMYLMIAFMGPDSQFLEPSLHELLQSHLKDFYSQNAQRHFDFDIEFADKANFEPLYYLFVNHFEAASYGDELFSSLVLLPLAQKYDNKWRRRLWSEHVQVMRFINCDESLLIGGLDAYLEPVEEEPSLLQLYGDALHRQLVRPGSIAYKIARHHFNNSTAIQKSKLF